MSTLKFKNPETGLWETVGMGGGGGGTSIPASDTEPSSGNYWLDTSVDGEAALTSYTKEEADERFAPAGFGLGENPTRVTDCNSCVYSGWYFTNENTSNCPGAFNSGVLIVHRRTNGRVYQEWASASSDTDVYKCARTGYGTDDALEWGEWEYINPPMHLGVEYRTTERYMGKPVYAKLVDCGAMPNKTIKSVTSGISSGQHLVSSHAMYYNSSVSVSLPWMVSGGTEIAKYAVCIYPTSISISLWASNDESAQNALVLVKYTKTTD